MFEVSFGGCFGAVCAGLRKRFLAASATILIFGALLLTGMLTGCAANDALTPPKKLILAYPTVAPVGSPLAAARVDLGNLRAITDVRADSREPYWAALDRPSQKPGPLLVVITYGNGCSAAGSGNGLRDVADAIRRKYPKERVITRGWNDDDDIVRTLESHRGPIALIGHSFGGCRSIELAAQVRRSVDWLILLDPVPCEDWAFPNPGRYFELPARVRNAICYYRPAGMFPISYPLIAPPSPLDNRLRLLGHSAFCRDAEVQQCILDTCGRPELQ